MSLVLSCLSRPLADRLRVMEKTTNTRPEVIAEVALTNLLDHWEKLEGADAEIE